MDTSLIANDPGHRANIQGEYGAKPLLMGCMNVAGRSYVLTRKETGREMGHGDLLLGPDVIAAQNSGA
jgi:hypothetical protein